MNIKILFLILLFLVPLANADNFYTLSNNQILSNDFKIVLNENIISDIIIDSQNIYYFTPNKFYSNNKTLGYENYNISISGIKNFSISDNNIFLKKSFEILTIDKDTGEILTKHLFNTVLDKIYSLTTSTLSTFYINVLGQPQLDSVTLIPGENIALSQDGVNKTITITGAATWSLSGLTTNDIYVNNIIGIKNSSRDNVIEFTNYSLWLYNFDNASGDLSYIILENVGSGTQKIKFKVCNYYLSDSDSCLTQADGSQPPELEIGKNQVKIMGKDIEQELVKTSIKSFQADYLNSSQIYSDIIIVPQDITLTNITVTIENSINSINYTLNFSLERFINYPTSKQTIFEGSFNNSINYINNIDYSFNNNDILLLNYTSYVNVSKSSSLFKFKVR